MFVTAVIYSKILSDIWQCYANHMPASLTEHMVRVQNKQHYKNMMVLKNILFLTNKLSNFLFCFIKQVFVGIFLT